MTTNPHCNAFWRAKWSQDCVPSILRQAELLLSQVFSDQVNCLALISVVRGGIPKLKIHKILVKRPVGQSVVEPSTEQRVGQLMWCRARKSPDDRPALFAVQIVRLNHLANERTRSAPFLETAHDSARDKTGPNASRTAGVGDQ